MRPESHRRSVLLVFALFAASVHAAGAQQSRPGVEYTVSLHHAHTQMVEVAIDVADVEEATIDFVLPAWRPGRYEILDLAGAVQDVRATDRSGNELASRKVDKNTWRVTTGGADAVRLSYRMYANELGDRTRHADETHAYLSGVGVFMYVPDRRDEPHLVHVDAPDGWQIAGGLEFANGDADTLVAPNYDVLIDTPLEIGLHEKIEFEVGGKPHEIVIWPTGWNYDAERMIEDFTKIVEVQYEIFDHLPYERYVFLIHAGAGAGGGTEHLNSTIMQTSQSSLEGSVDNSGAYQRFLGLVSHEFFHTWNVKQLRPAGIHPYDYTKENYSTLFWVAEGTTSYYDDLTLVRAGIMPVNRYLSSMARSFGSNNDRPGAAVQSLEESSFDAWIKFNQPNAHSTNTTVSFYSKGALVSLMIDLKLRTRTRGGDAVTLDDVMKTMYERFPLSGPGFTPQDLQGVLEEMSGSDFDEFWAKYIAGTEPLDPASLFEVVGLEFRFEPGGDDEDDEESDDADEDEDDDGGDDAAEDEDQVADDDAAGDEIPMEPYLGINLAGASVRSVMSDGPAFAAGIIVDDEIIALDDRRVEGSLDGMIGDLDLAPGDTITLHIMRRDRLREVQITLAGKPDGRWRLERVDEPTEAQKAAYESWLGQEWPERRSRGGDDDEAEGDEGDGEGRGGRRDGGE